MRLLLLGATGLVGGSALKLAIANPAISEVVAATRRPLAPRDKLVNPVNERLEKLAPLVKDWKVDAVICALGTTKAKAGRKKPFAMWNMSFRSCSRRRAMTLASKRSLSCPQLERPRARWFFMLGRKESWREMFSKSGSVHSRSAGRAIIGGPRNEVRTAENLALALSGVFAPVLPKKFHVNPASVIAASLLDSVLAARPGLRWIFAEELN